jgi:putative transposase
LLCRIFLIACGMRVHPARTPLSLDDARRLVEGYVEPYNNIRLNSAVGCITPKDVFAGRQAETHAERDRKLEEARKQRQIRRQQAA